MSQSAAVYRNKQLAAIHAAKRTLDLDEAAYRDLIERVGATKGKPVRSSKLLTPAQREAVLNEFKRLGGLKPSPKAKGKPRNFDARAMPLMITKIEALLADMSLPWSYADAIAKRQFRIERVAWCQKESQLKAIIAALYVEQEKRVLLAGIERVCKAQGLSLEDLEARYNLGQTPNWRRDRAVLKRLSEALTFSQAREVGHG